MLNALLIELNILLVIDIEFICHFLTLAFIVHHEHGIAHHQPVVEIVLADGVDVIFQNVQQGKIRVWDEIQVAIDADLVCLHPIESWPE